MCDKARPRHEEREQTWHSGLNGLLQVHHRCFRDEDMRADRQIEVQAFLCADTCIDVDNGMQTFAGKPVAQA